jgi:lysozyme family protein
MEGGYTDDPDDPGGRPNRVVMLEIYCRHTGLKLDAMTRELRIRELRAISDERAREIYLQRYWRPSRASQLSPASCISMQVSIMV